MEEAYPVDRAPLGNANENLASTSDLSAKAYKKLDLALATEQKKVKTAALDFEAAEVKRKKLQDLLDDGGTRVGPRTQG
jgi:hypothetical protein